MSKSRETIPQTVLAAWLPVAEEIAHKQSKGLPKDVTDTLALDCLLKAHEVFDPARSDNFRATLYYVIWQSLAKRRARRPLPALLSEANLEKAMGPGQDSEAPEGLVEALREELPSIRWFLNPLERDVLEYNLMGHLTLADIAHTHNVSITTTKRSRKAVLDYVRTYLEVKREKL